MRFVSPLDSQAQAALRHLMKTHAVYQVRQRAHAILLSAKGYKVNQLADIFDVDRDAITEWFNRWESGGVEGLENKPRSGRPPSLSPEDFLRISLARRSSRISRSSSFILARSSLVVPARRPSSFSCWRTHLRSVSGVQPIFCAIDWIVAHCDGWSRSCSNTIRTARSRTSGEYLVLLFMTPSSQFLESPANPGRFSSGKCGGPMTDGVISEWESHSKTFLLSASVASGNMVFFPFSICLDIYA